MGILKRIIVPYIFAIVITHILRFIILNKTVDIIEIIKQIILSYSNKAQMNAPEDDALEDELDIMNKDPRAYIIVQTLLKLIDRDMTMGRVVTYTFYYKYEPHTIGVKMGSMNKLIYFVDTHDFGTLADVTNGAMLSDKYRLSNISEKVMITEVNMPGMPAGAYQLSSDTLLKDSILYGSDKEYDNEVVKKDI